MLPNYIIIGAARCGTTWIGKNLMLHPDIFMPTLKEIHFFDKNYSKGIAWYENFFKERTQKAIGEATPGYLYTDGAAQLINKHCPDAKLIVCLRDPVERTYSHFMYREHERKTCNDSMTFEEIISWTPEQGMPRLVEESLYFDKLSQYYELFPKENILVVYFDDLKQEPENFLVEIYRFLGVDQNFKSQLSDKKVNTSASKIGKARIFFHVYKALNKFGFYGFASTIDKFNSKKLPLIQAESRKLLLDEYYMKDIIKLEKLLERDLSQWKKY